MYNLERYSNGIELKNVFIFYYYQKVLCREINNRPISSVALFLSGTAKYRFNNKDLVVKGGDTVYFPKGCSYSYEIEAEKPYIMQVEFNLFEVNDNAENDILFSDEPIILRGLSYKLKPLFNELAENKYVDRFKSVMTTFRILDICRNAMKNITIDKDFKKILPALQYIEQHVTDHISLEQIAKISCISQTHLSRLFNKCIGMSPIKYKNSILSNIAQNMLINEGFNVGETADILKFPDIYTFSQFFKKEFGISPRKFIQQNK